MNCHPLYFDKDTQIQHGLIKVSRYTNLINFYYLLQARKFSLRYRERARPEVDASDSPRIVVVDSHPPDAGHLTEPRQAQRRAKDDLHEAPFSPKHMPRNRYDQISTCLHFEDEMRSVRRTACGSSAASSSSFKSNSGKYMFHHNA